MAFPLAALLAVLAGAGPPATAGAPARPGTRVALVDPATGRTLATHVLAEGESAVLRWRNSLFGLDVTEVFVARSGGLVLASVTFAEPAGGAPPRVRPEDVDDLYHTGGAFHAEGLARPVAGVTFRVGELGRPRLTLGDRTVAFHDEVGFGGAVRLEVRPAARLRSPRAKSKGEAATALRSPRAKSKGEAATALRSP